MNARNVPSHRVQAEILHTQSIPTVTWIHACTGLVLGTWTFAARSKRANTRKIREGACQVGQYEEAYEVYGSTAHPEVDKLRP
jgi:hypothetical protein